MISEVIQNELKKRYDGKDYKVVNYKETMEWPETAIGHIPDFKNTYKITLIYLPSQIEVSVSAFIPHLRLDYEDPNLFEAIDYILQECKKPGGVIKIFGDPRPSPSFTIPGRRG